MKKMIGLLAGLAFLSSSVAFAGEEKKDEKKAEKKADKKAEEKKPDAK